MLGPVKLWPDAEGSQKDTANNSQLSDYYYYNLVPQEFTKGFQTRE